jgi:O-antigen ligase
VTALEFSPDRDAAPGYRAALPFRLGCLFIVLVCFPGLGEAPGGISLALLLMLASAPVWYVAACARRGPVLDPPSRKAAGIVLLCTFFLILWSLASAVDSDVPFRAARYIATLAAAFAVFFLVIGTVTEARLRSYLDVLCFALAFTCLMSLIGYVEPHLRARIFMGTDRAFGFFKNSNQFGMALSTTLPIAVALVLGEQRGRLMRTGGLVLLLLGLIASGSKTNLLLSFTSLVVMLCSYSIVAFHGARRVSMIGLSLVSVVLLVSLGTILLEAFNPRALTLMLAFLEQDGELQSIASRGELWSYSIRQFLAHPFLGQGAGQPIEVFYQLETVQHSHNVLLDYLRTLGAPGVLSLAVLLGTAIFMALATILRALNAPEAAVRHRLLCIGLAVASLSYIAANMSSDSMGPSTSPFFWLILFLGFAGRSLLRR